MNKSKNKATQLVQYVNVNWNKGMSLKQTASEYEKDPSDIERILRQETDMTYLDLINERRKQALMKLLEHNSNIPEYVAAKELGFAVTRTFQYWMKRTFGKTFSQLRAMYRRTQ